MAVRSLSTAGRDTQIAAAGGAVGLYEARELERAIVSGIGQGRTRVVVDLTEVTDVGPGLLGVLLRLRRGVTRVGGSVVLVAAGPPVSALVETTLLAVLSRLPVTGPKRSPSSAGAASRPVIAGRHEPSSAASATSDLDAC